MHPHAAVALHSTLTVRPAPPPDGGPPPTLPPRSFAEWVGHTVLVPGLDPGRPHTLVGVDVAADGSSVDLTVQTDLAPGDDLLSAFHVDVDTPEARLRIVDHETGEVIAETTHPTPLAVGGQHRVAGDPIHVVDTSWPNRHPEHGAVQRDDETGEYPHDVQEVRVLRVPAPALEGATA